jgi:hypothetical protein
MHKVAEQVLDLVVVLLFKVVQVEVGVEHHTEDRVVLVHKEILVDQEVILDKVHLVEVDVHQPDKEDVKVEVEMVDMVVHILHMVVQVDGI